MTMLPLVQSFAVAHPESYRLAVYTFYPFLSGE
jgi:hypothetical protein